MRLLNRFPSRWTMAFLIGAALVAVCYAYVDVPLAWWAHHHQLRQYGTFHGLQALVDGLVLLAPVALLTVGWRRVRGRAAALDRMAQAALGADYSFASDVLNGVGLSVFVAALVIRFDARCTVIERGCIKTKSLIYMMADFVALAGLADPAG